MGQLAQIAPIGEDAIPKLLGPFEVSGHRRHVLPQDCTAWPQLKHKAWINSHPYYFKLIPSPKTFVAQVTHMVHIKLRHPSYGIQPAGWCLFIQLYLCIFWRKCVNIQIFKSLKVFISVVVSYPISVLIKDNLAAFYFLVEHVQQHIVVRREQLVDPRSLEQGAENLQQLDGTQRYCSLF